MENGTGGVRLEGWTEGFLRARFCNVYFTEKGSRTAKTEH